MKRVVRHRRGRHRHRGLSLPELAICMAIVAVIAAYAMPSYRAYLMRGYRADGVSAAYRVLHHLERSELDARAGEGEGATAPSAEPLPADLAQSPQSGAAVYRLAVLPADGKNGGYTVQASPSESGPMRDDVECGDYLLDATGRRANRIAADVTTQHVARCWEGR
ncbi:type IV pilin protein [Burkholderia sp. L27(2015)]|uniref:type IV pilin protein n=1 Tax=Burkholderia sp. L27(2015) TaxID=1641858 RepID=UPI00131E3708|nr:type IV pilin protein [Burkholderia sp. L27(2015)]